MEGSNPILARSVFPAVHRDFSTLYDETPPPVIEPLSILVGDGYRSFEEFAEQG